MKKKLSSFQAQGETKVLSKSVKQCVITRRRNHMNQSTSRLKLGAGDEIRTRDFLLGKQTFYR
jgi:hypothetical protein